ncbi:MAG: phosphatidate cytidylyltransferase [Selenomonadaceae bacterium]|nr:phosphatidate cytidylyltransferase [Selenomonadaceae bacterium]
MITRILTGIVGIGAMTFIIQSGGWYFAAFVLLLSLIGWHEFSRACANKGIRTTYFTGFLALLLLWGCSWLGSVEELMAVATVFVLFALLLAVLLNGRIPFMGACASVAGVLYIGLPLGHMVMLRFWEGPNVMSPLGSFEIGCALIWIMFIGTWASDTFAYFTGSAIGSHKLCPSISPNKTVEGFLGSVVGTTASVAALGSNFFPFSMYEMAALGFAISIFATLGDLVESVFKRYTGIKDSGSLIPGHGGVLDRFDSVLYTAPLVYYFAYLVL